MLAAVWVQVQLQLQHCLACEMCWESAESVRQGHQNVHVLHNMCCCAAVGEQIWHSVKVGRRKHTAGTQPSLHVLAVVKAATPSSASACQQ